MAKTILVVEDDQNISELLRLYLEKEGYTVNIADEDGGKEAFLLEAGCALKDAGVVTFGVNYLAGIIFQNFDKIFKHFGFPPKKRRFWPQIYPNNTLTPARAFFKYFGRFLFTSGRFVSIIYRL